MPGRASPGRLEMKMCSISVDPMPSSTSTPNRSRMPVQHPLRQRLPRGNPLAHGARTRRRRRRWPAAAPRNWGCRTTASRRRPWRGRRPRADWADPVRAARCRRPTSGRTSSCRCRRRRTAWPRTGSGPSAADAEHAPAVELGDQPDVDVAVHGSLGFAGGAGGVEPQGGRIGPGRVGAVELAARPAQLAPAQAAHVRRQLALAHRFGPGQHQVPHFGRLAHGLADGPGELAGADHGLGARVHDQRAQFAAGQHGRGRHGDRAEVHGGQDGDEQFDVVGHAHQHALFRAHAEFTQATGDLAHLDGEFGVGQRASGATTAVLAPRPARRLRSTR